MPEKTEDALRQLLAAMQRGELLEAPIPGDRRYANLPQWKREWIEGLTQEKAKALDDIIRHLRPSQDHDDKDRLALLCQLLEDYSGAKVLGKAGKWLGAIVVGFFGLSYAAAKGGLEIFGWLRDLVK